MRRYEKRIVSWLVIGKGADMQGIIHEWGASEPNVLVNTIESIIADFDLTELTLLSPVSIDQKWRSFFDAKKFEISSHSMALVKPMSGSDLFHLPLNDSFIWGLDSI